MMDGLVTSVRWRGQLEQHRLRIMPQARLPSALLSFEISFQIVTSAKLVPVYIPCGCWTHVISISHQHTLRYSPRQQDSEVNGQRVNTGNSLWVKHSGQHAVCSKTS